MQVSNFWKKSAKQKLSKDGNAFSIFPRPKGYKQYVLVINTECTTETVYTNSQQGNFKHFHTYSLVQLCVPGKQLYFQSQHGPKLLPAKIVEYSTYSTVQQVYNFKKKIQVNLEILGRFPHKHGNLFAPSEIIRLVLSGHWEIPS